MSRIMSCSLLVLLILAGGVNVAQASGEENIARGCAVTVSPSPNYWNSGNAVSSLTDGVYTSGKFWTQKTTVGWALVKEVSITIDLGGVQPVSGVSFSTAAGAADVFWPASILVLMSDDGDKWRYGGDLVALSAQNGAPPSNGYATFRFVTHDLRARGRYLRLIAPPVGPYLFADEIEVYRGSDDFLTGSAGEEVVVDIPALLARVSGHGGITRRLMRDASSTLQAVEASKLTEAEKSRLRAEIRDIVKEIADLPEVNPDQFRAILPLNSLHGRIFSVNAVVMRSHGLPRLFAWKKDRYDPVTPTETPAIAPKNVNISMFMMKNEFRADAFMLTNASESPVEAEVTVQGLPGGNAKPWLGISAVPWTDTAQGIPLAVALSVTNQANGAFKVPLPAGMTRKVWVAVDSSKLPSGKYRGHLRIATSRRTISLPFNIHVSPVKMSKPRLSLGMWDYCSGTGAYGIGPANIRQAIDMMRSHFVDSPWAPSGVLPMPKPDSFGAQGKLVKPLDFTEFDRWVKDWKGARRYLVFSNVEGQFAGARIGTPEFDARVGEYALSLDHHMDSLGLRPSQLGLLLRDEPDEAGAAVAAAWAKAIKTSGAKISVFQDSTPDRPDQTKELDRLLGLSDILCPNLPQYYAGSANVEAYFAHHRSQGRALWFYRCEGPARLLDPYRYYRLLAWYCFRHDAVGMGIWAFGDIGSFGSSWDEYSGGGTSYSPVFIAPDSITTGVQWEAVREGLEDYEYLAMLRDAAGKTDNSALKSRAESLLKKAVAAVLGDKLLPVDWNAAVDRSVADKYRRDALTLLEQMPVSPMRR